MACVQANMLSQFFYPYKHVELLDCLLEPQSVYRLVRRVSRRDRRSLTEGSAVAEKPRDAPRYNLFPHKNGSSKLPNDVIFNKGTGKGIGRVLI